MKPTRGNPSRERHDLSLVVLFYQRKTPKLQRIICPCRTHKTLEKQEKTPIIARTFLAKNQPRKSKQSRKGMTGEEMPYGKQFPTPVASVRFASGDPLRDSLSEGLPKWFPRAILAKFCSSVGFAPPPTFSSAQPGNLKTKEKKYRNCLWEGSISSGRIRSGPRNRFNATPYESNGILMRTRQKQRCATFGLKHLKNETTLAKRARIKIPRGGQHPE